MNVEKLKCHDELTIKIKTPQTHFIPSKCIDPQHHYNSTHLCKSDMWQCSLLWSGQCSLANLCGTLIIPVSIPSLHAKIGFDFSMVIIYYSTTQYIYIYIYLLPVLYIWSKQSPYMLSDIQWNIYVLEMNQKFQYQLPTLIVHPEYCHQMIRLTRKVEEIWSSTEHSQGYQCGINFWKTLYWWVCTYRD